MPGEAADWIILDADFKTPPPQKKDTDHKKKKNTQLSLPAGGYQLYFAEIFYYRALQMFDKKPIKQSEKRKGSNNK
jgi:hypothetical protein